MKVALKDERTGKYFRGKRDGKIIVTRHKKRAMPFPRHWNAYKYRIDSGMSKRWIAEVVEAR